MFKCESCKKFSKPGDKATKVIVEERQMVYPPRYKEDEFGRQAIIDKGGEGFETIREVTVCPACVPAEA